MARISLLFSLAFVLALGSLFISVSGHAPPVPPKKPACPKTVSELQTLPFTQITEILNRKERLAPKTAEFKAMFTLCKDYVAYLESLYKFENPIVDVLGIAKIRYALMTKAILAAQASVSSKVNKETSLKLKKTYADLSKAFLKIKETIVKISAKHQYNADAKITAHESKKINHAMINFKNSINAFMNVLYNLEKNKMKKLGHHARALVEDQDRDTARNAFAGWFFNKFGGYLGGKTHGRELTEAEYNANSHAGTDVKGLEAIYDKISHFFGGHLGGHQTHGRELYTIAPGSGKFFDSFFGDKAHGRELYTIPPGSGKFFDSFFGDKAHGRELYTIPPGSGKFFDSFFGDKAHGRELYTIPPGSGKFFDSFFGDKAHGRELYTIPPGSGKFFDSFFGGKTHGRELYFVGPDGANAEAPAGVNAASPTGEITKDVSQSNFDRFFREFFGPRGKSHRRELYISPPDEVNAKSPSDEITKDVSQSNFDRFFYEYFGPRGKSHRRGLYVQAPAGGRSFADFLGFGGKAQYDAAGKMKVAGEDGFRSLNRAHYKHFASTEA